MSNWAGIVGQNYNAQDFSAYVSTLTFLDWKPRFVVLHNTSVPKLADWPKVPGLQRMRNLESYYRDQQHWSAGPHLFIASDFIWVFTPLTVPGVHSPSWNALSWGVEMVGDFESEPFDAGVRTLTVSALATLHSWRGLEPSSLRLHKEDPRTTHKTCPGRNVSKSEIIDLVSAEMARASPGEHLPQV